MKQGLLLLQWCLPSPSVSFQIPASKHARSSIAASISSANAPQQELTTKERRQLRNQRRGLNAGYNWREEVEDRLIKKPKIVLPTAGEARNLDNLADLGPQWYVVRVARVNSHLTAELIAKLLARDYPDLEFKVYAPSVKIRNKLKNGSVSIKSKPIFPGNVFLWCVLNREIHDFVREVDKVGGFVGSKVGNMKRQINRPRPVSVEDMEKIFQEAKDEQEKFDQEEQEKFDQEEQQEDTKKPVGRSNSLPKKRLTTGSTVKVLSGNFADFVGSVKKISRKTGKASVGFSLFGKETIVELDLDEIAPETE